MLLQDYDEAFTSLRKAEGIGFPLGTADFVIELERRLGRPIARRAPGRKAAATAQGEQLNLLPRLPQRPGRRAESRLGAGVLYWVLPGDSDVRETMLMSRTCTFISCALAMSAIGCFHPSIGPHSLPRDRALYSVSLADSWKEQTLLNILKIRYVDPPVFVDIGNIVSSYSLLQSASLGGNIVPSGGSSIPLGAAGTFSNSPTIDLV